MYPQPLISILVVLGTCIFRANCYAISDSMARGEQSQEKEVLASLFDAIMSENNAKMSAESTDIYSKDASMMQSTDIDVCKQKRDPRTIQWPKGKYALLQTSSGCPAGFDVGCIFQDNEDTDNQNRFAVTPLEAKFSDYVAGEFGVDTKLCYCVKQSVNGDPSFSWPPGRYCIVSKGGCHSGFRHGEIFWDDESTNNQNKQFGVCPDGRFDPGETQLNFCCRLDGDTDNEIVLPTEKPFILYQTQRRGCQKVAGMGIRELYMHMDNQDGGRSNYVGYIPYIGTGCPSDRDHSLRACYYYPIY